MLGKLQPRFFPNVFGPEGDQALDAEVVTTKFAALAEEIARATGDRRSPFEVAEGYLRIAVDSMASAIKKISVQRGYDVTKYTMNCFGGAGGQHACLVADALGMTRILVHPFAGVLSAYGMGLADISTMREQAVEAKLREDLLERLEGHLSSLIADGLAELAGQGVSGEQARVLRKAHVKYDGSDTALIVDYGDLATITANFEAAHHQQFGFIAPDKGLVLESVSVEIIGGSGSEGWEADIDQGISREVEPIAVVDSFMGSEARRVPLYDRDSMKPGDAVQGPAIVRETISTIVVEPGWRAAINGKNHVVMERVEALPSRVAIGTAADPVMLEVFNNLFMSIAEQMGVTLQNTSYSANIKERLDFSCAVFDAAGGLVANAPHVPVHLGSMGDSVRAIIERRRGTIRAGDVFMLNDPYNGGTHLPDITIITPVFDDAGQQILFYVASRAHHADIGGVTPGSMPPDSGSIEHEGVLIDNFHLVDVGTFQDQAVVDLLSSGPYPARNIKQNLADLKAQIAANEKGVQELQRMERHFGLDVVQAYMKHVQDNAEEQVRRVLDVLKDAAFEQELDDGSKIKVTIRINKADRFCGDRFHRYQRATTVQLQRTARDYAGGGPLRLSHSGRRRHSDERGLFQTASACRARGLDAEPGLSRRRGRRQRRGQSVRDRRALRRARNHGVRARHDEQLHLRQRNLSALRDDLRWLGRRPRVRWHLGGAHPHDQQSADGPGGVGVALSRHPGVLRDTARLGRRRQMVGRRRHAPAGSLSRADDRGDFGKPPPGSALRPRRGRPGRARSGLGRATGRLAA